MKKTIAILSILSLAPIAAWCRYKAIQFEPENIRLKEFQKTLQQQIAHTEAQLKAQNQQHQIALQQAQVQLQSQLKAQQAKHQKTLDKKDFELAQLRHSQKILKEQLAQKPTPSYNPYSYNSGPRVIQGSLGENQGNYPKRSGYSSYYPSY